MQHRQHQAVFVEQLAQFAVVECSAPAMGIGEGLMSMQSTAVGTFLRKAA